MINRRTKNRPSRILAHIFVVLCAVFNLEIMESGSNVPRDILSWVISKMVWVKLL